jgi:hypothetical protein
MLALFVLLSLGALTPAAEPDKKPDKPANDKIKEVAGTAEYLRHVPKHFGTLKAVDATKRQVTILLDGETGAKDWPLLPDAEVKLSGWWARLDQLTVGDRVWIWFQTNRKKQPTGIAMLCDELSEQDMHGSGVVLDKKGEGILTYKSVKGAARTVKVEKLPALDAIALGKQCYVQTAGDQARLLLDPTAFETRRAEQKAALRKRWVDEGLPGTVSFLHRFSGEMELMLDHECMRWGRSLNYGDKVTLQADPPINAVVKKVAAWRERTQLRLVVNSFDQCDLNLGDRVRLKMTPPAAAVENSLLPPDIDRPRSKEERLDWILASIYCTCQVRGDTCTGDFYTLASCNPNACGMPNHQRKTIAALIDKGMTDKEIFEQLIKENGPELLRPHLLP